MTACTCSSAIQKANSTEPDAIRDALEATAGFVGTSGVFTMSPTDHMGLKVDSFRMLEIKDGDWTLVEAGG